MKTSRPRVGVTGPEKGGTAAWLFTKLAVWLQGGRAVRITPSEDPRIIGEIDALVLGGGADIHPDRYGEHLLGEYEAEIPPPSGVRQWLIRTISILFYPVLFLIRKLFSVSSITTDRQRDELELELLRSALDNRIPVLGICRGAQLINVHMGGTLHQDIDGFYVEVPRVHTIWPRKKVKVVPGSRLDALFDRSEIAVNALHHQAIRDLAPPLKAVAKEKNGIIQAIEMENYPFLIGVQWHPEYIPQQARQRKIFRALVTSADRIQKGSL